MKTSALESRSFREASADWSCRELWGPCASCWRDTNRDAWSTEELWLCHKFYEYMKTWGVIILNRKVLGVTALFHGTMLAIHVVSSLSCPWLAMQFPVMLLWEILSFWWSRSQTETAWLVSLNILMLGYGFYFIYFSFLVLNAENQKGDMINLLDQREKKNQTLWINWNPIPQDWREITTTYLWGGWILWNVLSKIYI